MEGGFFHTIFYQPIYNLLVFLIDTVPGHSIGLAVILTTIIVRLVLYPLSKKALITQMRMREIEPKIEEIKKKYKNDNKLLAEKTMALYREEGVNPFASILTLIIQIPVILALFWIFSGSKLPSITVEDLYSFVNVPEAASMIFLGIFDMAAKSWPLAILAGATQFLQARISLPPIPVKKDGVPSFKDDLARSMNIQIRYILPVVIIFISHTLAAAVALYWTVGNIFTILQELYIKRALKSKVEHQNV